MMIDLDDDPERSDPLPAHIKRKRGHLFSSRNSALKGTLKTILARSKGRKQKVSLPKTNPRPR